MKLDQHQLQDLIRCHNSVKVQQISGHIPKLIDMGMLEEYSDYVRTTKKARVWLKQVLDTPLPEVNWVIPD